MADRAARGPGTRAVHAGLPDPEQGAPLLPSPVFASTYHLAGPADASPYGYARYANPTWTHLEAALGELEGGDALVFSSGMAALTAVLFALVRPGGVLVACGDGYPGVRGVANDRLGPRGVDVRLVPTDTEAVLAAITEGSVVWVETPSNPRLDVCDVAAIAEAAHARGALLAVDNTLATPLIQRPLALGADVSVVAATKALSGHSDLLLGYAAFTDEAIGERLRGWRSQTGAVASPFEAWLAHRSIATLDLRLERMSASSLALARLLAGRADVREVRHPGLPGHPGHALAARQMRRWGPLVGFDVGGAVRAQRFLAACELVSEATSFGGVHSTAERRARWGTDAVGDGFIRLSAGCEDTDDLLADVARALDATA